MLAVDSGPIITAPFASSEDGEFKYYYQPDGIAANFSSSLSLEYVDYEIPFDCKIDGVMPILKNHSFGDYIYMELGVLNPDNSGALLGAERFGIKYFVDDSIQKQDWIETKYSASLSSKVDLGGIEGQVVLRIFFYRTDLSKAVDAAFNLRLHKRELVSEG